MKEEKNDDRNGNHWIIQKFALIAEERNWKEWIKQGEREK